MQRKRASSLNALVVEDLILKSRRRIAIPLRLVGLDEDTIGPECARCVGDEKRPPGHDSAIGASRSVHSAKAAARSMWEKCCSQSVASPPFAAFFVVTASPRSAPSPSA